MRANMRLEQYQQLNTRAGEELHQTTEECRFQGNFDARRFTGSVDFSWARTTTFK
jgi:hypothetical protein